MGEASAISRVKHIEIAMRIAWGMLGFQQPSHEADDGYARPGMASDAGDTVISVAW